MRYLIWSNKHGLWWRDHENGYTRYIEEAGKYHRDEAMAIVSHSTVNGALKHNRTNPMTGEKYISYDSVMVQSPFEVTE